MNTAILNIERTDAPETTARTMTVIAPRAAPARKTRVAAYARVSSDSADQQNSYISQVRHYMQTIRENEEWEYVDIYADEGLSGLDAAKRKDFQRMLADCRKRKIDRILCKSVSRFARNFHECIWTIRELKMMGVSVLLEKERIDTARMGDELELQLQALWAQRESISHAGNLRRGIRMKMKTGTFLASSTPYGYTPEGRTLAVDAEQAEVVRRIFAEYLSGKGMLDIADGLEREGVPKRFGKGRWHHTTIFYILTNLSYTGDTVWQKSFTSDTLPFRKVKNNGEKTRYHVQNDHPAIISQEDFEKAQELLAQRRAKHAPPESEGHVLTGMVVCGHCGRIHRHKLTKGTAHWVCRRHDHSKSRCPAPPVLQSELYAAFARMWNKLRSHSREIIGPMLEQFQALADRRYKASDRISQVNSELNALAEQVLVLKRLRSKEYMESALYYSKTQEIGARIKELRTLKASLMEQEHTETAAALEALQATLESGPEWLDGFDEDLFETMVERITVTSPEQVKFRLFCGLELAESIRRAVR